MPVSYANLVNKNGTIYNTQTGQGYSSPTALAADLGISASAINWESIASSSSYVPGTKLGGTPAPVSTPASAAPASPASTPAPSGLNINQVTPGSSTYVAPAAGTTVNNGAPDTGSTPATNVGTAPAGATFTGSAAYQALTPDQQAVINTMYNVYASGTTQQQNLLINAVSSATAQADPYYKSLLAITMGEFGTQLAQDQNDYNSKVAIINATQSALQANVNNQSNALSLQNQVDLSQAAQTYQNDSLAAQAQAANQGTVQGTGYKTLAYTAGQLALTNQNTVSSINTQYNYQQQALQLQASQGNIQAQLQLQQQANDQAATLQGLGQTAETSVGSGNVASLGIPGYTPQGGFIGTVPQAESQDILTGIGNYFNLNKPST
jgi:hypothetical protein